MTPTITESDVEAAALNWLAGVGWRIAHGPDIAPTTGRWYWNSVCAMPSRS